MATDGAVALRAGRPRTSVLLGHLAPPSLAAIETLARQRAAMTAAGASLFRIR